MTLTTRTRPSPSALKQDPLSGFLQRVGITDVLVITWAVLGAQLIRFGQDPVSVFLSPGEATSVDLKHTAFSIVLLITWLVMLRTHGAYDRRLIGHGPEEYRAVATASLRLFGVITVVSYVFHLEIARGYVAMAMPAGMVGLLSARWLWRKWLTMHRSHGLLSGSVLVVGRHEHLVNLIRALDSVPSAGYHVVAACCTDSDQTSIGRVPVVGVEEDASEIAGRMGVSTVACTSSWALGADGLRRLSWALEGQNIQLVVAPELMEVAGPRVLVRPVAGLSLLHVEAPVFAGPQLALKTAFDRVAAAALLILLSPLLAVLALRIKQQDLGPVFFRQERVGKDGSSFPMLKFRTMVIDAEAMLPSLLARNDAQGPLFKLADDPRVTRIGSVLRRYSLDELPQLVNVVRGQMSLVGPRPPLAREVETYGSDVHRRLLVKPGMTGLWQINGRSDLSWDESVRYDLYYVENWSVMSDLIILWRTARAVLHSSGAY